MLDLERALRDVEDRTQILRCARDQRLFRSSVQAWCDVLDWPTEVADLALSLDRLHEVHLGRVAARIDAEVRDRKKSSSRAARIADRAKLAGAFVSDGLRAEDADYMDATKGAMLKMDTRDYLLIALAVAAGGYVAYRLTSKPSRQELRTASPVVEPARKVLVLVINAGRESVIDALRTGGGSALQRDQLYQATQALWLGSAAEFERSDLAQWFGTERAVTEPSEYDVHLIRLDIAADDAGLHHNANQMDRLDAFRRLQVTGFKATVSLRLPSDAYGTTDVYSR
jgi:hypothetical protein